MRGMNFNHHILCFLVLTGAIVGEARANALNGKYSALRGDYLTYSGDLGDMGLPKHGDMKVSIEISGALAAEIYKQLGPGAKQKECSESVAEIRERRDIACILDKGSTSPRCYFGLNVQTGRSISGSEC